jgi:thioredoxin reductase
MNQTIEQLIVYGTVFILCLITIYLYLRNQKKNSQKISEKVKIAKEEGLFEPISLHPYINLNTCIGSAACVSACPEKDILGIVNGKATVINTSNCIGHGACFHDCPVEAISLRIGTESRGVELPHVNENFETNIKGVFIAGELGGMGLIKNSVEQGKQAIDSIKFRKMKPLENGYDVLIIGAGPAGISASLAAKKQGLKAITLEQDSLGGTVYTFPRAKIVMTSPMDLPIHGKVKLYDTSKDELLNLWKNVISENQLNIKENTKVEQIIPLKDGHFKIITKNNEEFLSNNVLMAIGKRGSPRKLNIEGENLPKVAYRLIESERIAAKKIMVVGGGNSAIESALLLMDNNMVTLSYRKDTFNRLKPMNKELIFNAIEKNKVNMLYNSNLISINNATVIVKKENETISLENDLVYIFAGGELPTNFLKNIGIEITKRFAYIVKKHA